jgi:hypothetical protein
MITILMVSENDEKVRAAHLLAKILPWDIPVREKF